MVNNEYAPEKKNNSNLMLSSDQILHKLVYISEIIPAKTNCLENCIQIVYSQIDFNIKIIVSKYI